MSTLFPTSIDTFVNPTAVDRLNTTGVVHHEQHTNENDAIIAIETYLGIRGSTVTGSITYTLNSLASTVSGSAGGGAPTSASYLMVSAHTGTAARTFTLGAGLSGTDAGSGSTFTTRIYPTGVTSGTYYSPAFTVNAQGQITFASDSGVGDGFVSGLPGAPYYLASFWFGNYVASLDRVYFDTKVATGSIYYIDRTVDLPVLVGTVSGKTPGVWIYSTIVTGFVMSHSTSSGFVCTVTGGSVVGVSLGMDGGACIRTTVSGQTIYANALGNARTEVFDPSSLTVTSTLATGAGGTDGRSNVFVSGVDCVYQARRDGDVIKINCVTSGVTTISGIGLNLGSRCSAAYNLNANKVFFCGGNAAATKTWYLTPGVDTISTLSFPSGVPVSDGAYVCYALGNFVYFMTNNSSPPLLLVLDAINLTWKYPLTIGEANSTVNFDKGNFIAGVQTENVLYAGTSNGSSVGYYSFGRYR